MTQAAGSYEEWTAKLALRSVADEAFQRRDVVEALVREKFRVDDAKRALLASETVLDRILIEQERLVRAGAPAGPPPVRPTPSEVAWLVLAAASGVGYLSLLVGAWPRLPLPWQVFGIVGLVAVLALSGRMVVRRVPAVTRRFGGPDFGTDQPHEEQLGLGDRRSFVLDEIVLPEVWELIRRNRLREYGTTLVFRELDGLYEEDASRLVVTEGTSRIQRIVRREDSAAVALAGYRGVGKTTVLRSVERGLVHGPGAAPPLVVVASAPAHYEPRDFVLHLHALLCKAVLGRIAEALGERVSRGRRFRSGLRRTARFLASVAGGTAVAILLWGGGTTAFVTGVADLVSSPPSPSQLWTGLPWHRLAALAVAGWVVLHLGFAVLALVFTGFAALVRGKRDPGLRELRTSAERHLDRIRFLQTHTTGWSGKLAMPLKSEATGTWSTQRAEQQLTHPEVVDEFREFAGRSAKRFRETGLCDRVVVAIDELDKIGEPEKAHQFVNDVKGVFGVPGCLFFVSVSDDAVLGFEQRGLAVRDAFDSAFSEMVRLTPFSLEESRLWVALRVVGVPEQFSCLCHCLSGGLPRDLRRYTIEMTDLAATVHQPSLSLVAATLVRSELAAKVHALSSMADPELSAALLSIPDTENPLELAELAHRLSELPGNLSRHAACFALFCATILEVFDDDLAEGDLGPGLHQLAVAKLQLAMHPARSWELLTEFRKSRGLDLGHG